MADALIWTRQSVASSLSFVDEEDANAELDEPPDPHFACPFRKSPISPPGIPCSLLTRALHGLSDEHGHRGSAVYSYFSNHSLASPASLASTSELTSDTGFTSASRDSTPSLPDMAFLCAPTLTNAAPGKSRESHLTDGLSSFATPVPKTSPKKRRISFACANGPIINCGGEAIHLYKTGPNHVASSSFTQGPLTELQPSCVIDPQAFSSPDLKKKSYIKFACATQYPVSQTAQDTLQTPAGFHATQVRQTPGLMSDVSSTPRKVSSDEILGCLDEHRWNSPARKSLKSAVALNRPKFIQPTSKELRDSSHFHEFALTDSQDDEWVEEDKESQKSRITIGDVMCKETTMRRLMMEAYKEADEENGELDDDNDDENDNGDDADEVPSQGDDEADEPDEEDENEERGRGGDQMDQDVGRNEYMNDWASDMDGYRSDEETGFAESDDENDFNSHSLGTSAQNREGLTLRLLGANRMPMDDISYGCSTPTECSFKSAREVMPLRRSKHRPKSPELPDSTDFVCGTFDEDRPLEAMYLSRLEAKKRHKLLLIPQDIDPSFPTSDLEGDCNERVQNSALRIDSDLDDGHRAHVQDFRNDGHVWLHGEMEGIHHEDDRSNVNKPNPTSLRRFHSPPPKRHRFPNSRGRAPRGELDHCSNRRLKSPVPIPRTRRFTDTDARKAGYSLDLVGGHTDPSQAKALSKPLGMMLHYYREFRCKPKSSKHIKGAIDIVKGVEQRRDRRREKVFQTYCDRARRGQIPGHKSQPGLGAERMKEVGLHVPKRGLCDSVISV